MHIEQPDDHRFGVVALLGPPNAGKSTLMNRVLGEKVSIVTPRPQTTRNRITGIWTTGDFQIMFLDTPGIHEFRGASKGRLNRMLVNEAWSAVGQADAAVFMADAARCLNKKGAFDQEVAPLARPMAKAGTPLTLAVNKTDLVRDKARLLELMHKLGELFPEADIFPVSALSGEGVDQLMKHVLDRLAPGPPMFPEDQISTLPLRFMAAEIVREKLFLALREELPYALAVEVQEWEEDPAKDLTRVHAVIFVTRDTHKAMVIGHKGRLLKQIGTQARAELEELVDQRVFLDLWVKVRPGWQEDRSFLASLGIGL
jgi:GTP-binding protein Era